VGPLFSTARVSCQGRPRLSARRCGRNTGSATAHCSSLSSHRPVTGASRPSRATAGSHEIAPQLFIRLILIFIQPTKMAAIPEDNLASEITGVNGFPSPPQTGHRQPKTGFRIRQRPQRKRHIWATGEDIVLPSCDQFPSFPRR